MNIRLVKIKRWRGRTKCTICKNELGGNSAFFVYVNHSDNFYFYAHEHCLIHLAKKIRKRDYDEVRDQ